MRRQGIECWSILIVTRILPELEIHPQRLCNVDQLRCTMSLIIVFYVSRKFPTALRPQFEPSG